MKVFLRRTAKKYLDSLNAEDKSRIKAAIIKLEKEPPEGDIKPIVGQPKCFRVRTSKYRIFFWILKDNTILIINIEPRGQAYKKKNRRYKR